LRLGTPEGAPPPPPLNPRLTILPTSLPVPEGSWSILDIIEERI